MSAPIPSGIHSGVPSRTVYVSGKPVATVKAPPAPVGKAAQGCNSVVRSNAVGARARDGVKEALRMACAHCRAPSYVRTSQQMTVLTREYTYACTNVECGHTFVVLAEQVRTLSPSATPDPSVNLPLSTHVRRDLMRATLDHAASAEHTTQFTCPVSGDLFAVGGTPSD